AVLAAVALLPVALLALVVRAVAAEEERTDRDHPVAVPAADDLAALVDAVRVVEPPAGVRRNLRVQVRHHAADDHEGVVLRIAFDRRGPDELTAVGAEQALAERAPQRAQVHDLAVGVERRARL